MKATAQAIEHIGFDYDALVWTQPNRHNTSEPRKVWIAEDDEGGYLLSFHIGDNPAHHMEEAASASAMVALVAQHGMDAEEWEPLNV